MDIDKLLKFMVQKGASDAFITAGVAPSLKINGKVMPVSDQTFTMWDDCMSFPFLLVRVRRHSTIAVRYLDDEGSVRVMDRLDQATSELLQHEIDHLDGILAVDHALDTDAIVSREVFEENPDWFAEKVDYVITPTV